MRSSRKSHRTRVTAVLYAGLAVAILMLGTLDVSAGGDSLRVQRWKKLRIYDMLLREKVLINVRSLKFPFTTPSPDRQFVDFRRSSTYSEAVNQEIYLTFEEIAAVVLLANLKTSMTPQGAFKQDLLSRPIIVHMNFDEVRRACGLNSDGCRASDMNIHLYAYPENFLCVDKGCSFFDSRVLEARALFRAKLIHELMHYHQPPHDPTCPADPRYTWYNPATDVQHPCLTNQWGLRDSWPRVEDQNTACFDSFVRKVYGFLPHKGFDEEQVRELCRVPYRG